MVMVVVVTMVMVRVMVVVVMLMLVLVVMMKSNLLQELAPLSLLLALFFGNVVLRTRLRTTNEMTVCST